MHRIKAFIENVSTKKLQRNPPDSAAVAPHDWKLGTANRPDKTLLSIYNFNPGDLSPNQHYR